MRAWRFSRVARGILLICTLLTALGVTGQQLVRGDKPRDAVPPRIQRIFVPRNSTDIWPRADWKPIKRTQLDALLAKVKQTAKAQSTDVIRRASYSAVFSGTTFKNGRFTLSLDGQNDASGLISLKPLSLRLSDLTWDDNRPAVWGTAPKVGVVLMTDKPQGEVSGNWSLPGTRRPGGIVFDVRVATAVRSHFLLTLPRHLRLRCDVGIVTVDSELTSDGPRVWRVELGGLTRCRMTVDSMPSNELPQPMVLLEDSVTNLVALPDQLRILSDLSLEVLEAPLPQLELRVDADVKIHSVASGNGVSLPLSDSTVDGHRRVMVSFDPPLQGSDHLLHVQASAPLDLDRQTRLPRIHVVGAVQGRALLNLTVSESLLLKRFTAPPEYRQVDPDRAGDAVSLQYYGDRGEFTAVVGWPRTDVSCRVHSRLTPAPDQWQLRTRMQWECRSGQRFSLSCEVPRNWEIVSVRLGDQKNAGSQPVENWQIVPAEGGGRHLVIHLQEALSKTRPLLTEIQAIRPVPAQQEATSIPTLLPRDADDFEILLSVESKQTAQPVLSSGTSYSPIEAANLPAAWKPIKIANDASSEDGNSTLYLLSAANQSTGQLHFQSEETEINVVADVSCDISSRRASEIFQLRFQAAATDLPRVYVFVTQPGPVINWELVGSDVKAVKARKLPTARHQLMNLPPSGELWEIELPAGVAANFQITGHRVRPFPAEGDVGLVFVPRSEEFSGELTVNLNNNVSPRFESRKLFADASFSAGGQTHNTFRWTYSEADANLQVAAQRETTSSLSAVIASIELRSQMSLTAGGEDHHQATYDLSAFPESAEFRWKMPTGARLNSVSQGQQLLEPFPDGDSFLLGPVRDGRAASVTIAYSTPTASHLGWKNQQLPLPEVEIPVLQFHWQLELPPGIRPHIRSTDAFLLNHPDGDPWQRRIFGPLCRTTDFPPLLPLPETGMAGESSGTQSEPQFAISTTAPGWRIWDVSFSAVPNSIDVVLWDQTRSKLLSFSLLIFCFILAGVAGIIGLKLQRGFIAGWLISCLAVAFVVSPAYAELAGGLVIGSLLACLLPLVEKLFHRDQPVQTMSVPPGSTRKFQPVITSCLLAAACGGHLIAQGQESVLTVADKQKRANPRLRILIPYDANDPRSERSEIVYIERADLASLQASVQQQDRSPDYLLSAAQYDLQTVGQSSALLKMRLGVEVLSSAKSVEVRIPFSHASLATADACRVNGNSHPILRAPNGTGFVLQLDGLGPPKTDSPSVSRKDIVELTLRLAANDLQDGQRLRVAIPQISDSRLSIPNNPKFSHVRLRMDSVASVDWAAQADDGPRTVELGPASRIEVNWSETRSAQLSAPEGVSVCLVEVTPSLIRYHARVSYRVTDAPIDHVIWRLPPAVTIRSIEGNAVVGHRSFTNEQGQSFVLIDLDKPQQSRFHLTAQFVLRTRIQEQRLTFPVLNLLHDIEGKPNGRNLEIIGVAAPREYELELKSIAPDGVRRLGLNDFAERWPQTALLPHAVFGVVGDAQLTARIRLLAPQRSVETVFSGRVSSQQFSWELNAEMDVQTALAFQHRLQLDPRLRIDTISVQQAGAERLHRSVRTRDQLVLYLKTGAIGKQTIRLTGTMPLKFPSSFALPAVGFFNAELKDAQVVLCHDPALSVTLLGDGALSVEPGSPNNALQQPGDLSIGRFNISSGIDMEQLIVQTKENSPQVVMDSLNVLDLRPGVQKLTTVLLFRVKQGHASSFTIRVPRQFENDYRVDSPQSYRQQTIDSGREITFLPEVGDREIFVAQLIFPIDLADDGTLTLDEITPVNSTTGERFLLTLFDDDTFGPTDEFSGLAEESLPQRLTARLPRDLPTEPQRRSYRGGAGAWRLQSRDEPESIDRTVALMDTKVSLGSTGIFRGQTTFFIMPCEDEQFVVTLPAQAELQAALNEEHRPVTTSVQEQEVTIALDAAQVGQVVTLHWTLPPAGSRFPWLSRFSCPSPQPRDFIVKQSTLTLLPTRNLITTPASDSQLQEATAAHALQVLEAEFEFRRAQTTAGHTQQTRLWKRFSQHQQQVADHFTQKNAASPDAQLAQLKTQFTDLDARVAREMLDSPEAEETEGESNEVLTEGYALPLASLVTTQVDGTNQTSVPRIWAIDKRLVYAFAAVLLLCAFVVLKKVSSRIGFSSLDWLIDHPWIAWSAVGICWWLLLAGGWIGLLIVAAAVISRFFFKTPEANIATEVDFVIAQG